MPVFFSLTAQDTKHALGLEQYLQDYGTIRPECGRTEGVHLQDRLEEFEDWIIEIPFESTDLHVAESVTMLCCPEDRRCKNKQCRSAEGKSVCADCEVPFCTECKTNLMAPTNIFHGLDRQPPARALANDLMVFYAPKTMYECNMTVMEMICSSVCITSMICFSMEVKYGHLLDTAVHKQDSRVHARGNATTFLMPWQSVLSELQKLESRQEASESPDLPLVGSQLQSVVQVLLKCSDEKQKERIAKVYTSG